MIVYAFLLGYIKIFDTSLPIGTLDILTIVCLLVVVKTYTVNSKILRRIEYMTIVMTKGFKENRDVVIKGFEEAEKKRSGDSIKSSLSIKNINNSVSSLSGLVNSLSTVDEDSPDGSLDMTFPLRRHSIGLELC